MAEDSQDAEYADESGEDENAEDEIEATEADGEPKKKVVLFVEGHTMLVTESTHKDVFYDEGTVPEEDPDAGGFCLRSPFRRQNTGFNHNRPKELDSTERDAGHGSSAAGEAVKPQAADDAAAEEPAEEAVGAAEVEVEEEAVGDAAGGPAGEAALGEEVPVEEAALGEELTAEASAIGEASEYETEYTEGTEGETEYTDEEEEAEAPAAE